MNSIVNLMTKYDHRQHELSDWLLELEQRFQLGQVDADRAKITWCQLLIGTTGSSILAGLEDETTWEAAKETLLSRMGAGSVRDEAWASLKQLTRGSKEIIELAGEAEKLAKCLHPRDEEAAERYVVGAFLSALDRPLAAEVRKLGHTNMEGVVADTRRIEKILQEQPTSGIDSLMESMNRQIQILKKDLLKAHDKLAAQTTAAPQTAALAVPPSHAVAAAQPHQPLLRLLRGHKLLLLSHHPWPQPKHPSTYRNTLHSSIEMKTLSTLEGPGDRTGDPCDASSVTRKGILPIAVLPARCCSAC